MEADAGVDACDQELIGTELRYQSCAMKIFITRRAAPVILGEAVGDAGLPRAEVQLLLRLAWLLDRRLQFAFEVQACDFPVHRAQQREVGGVRLAHVVAQDIPSGLIHAERGESDGTIA